MVCFGRERAVRAVVMGLCLLGALHGLSVAGVE